MTEAEARSPAAEPPPELVARFKEALDRLWPEGGRLGLAVSGGPDSLAMLLLAEAAIPGQFEVATVDHGLRPEAADECAMVARLCAEHDVPCQVLRVTVQPGNVQAMARQARYDGMAEWAERRNIPVIATAHHADDQAETLLMRLNRASGLEGLVGVRGRSHVSGKYVDLIRPLLRFRRAELHGIVEQAGLEPVNDPSNEDMAFDRVRLRKAIAEETWLNPIAIARSAELLEEAREALEWVRMRDWQVSVDRTDDGLRCFVDRAGLDNSPRTLVIGVLRSIFDVFEAKPTDAALARLLDVLLAGKPMNIAGVQATPGSASGQRIWYFAPENPRRSG